MDFELFYTKITLFFNSSFSWTICSTLIQILELSLSFLSCYSSQSCLSDPTVRALMSAFWRKLTAGKPVRKEHGDEASHMARTLRLLRTQALLACICLQRVSLSATLQLPRAPHVVNIPSLFPLLLLPASFLLWWSNLSDHSPRNSLCL